MKTIKGTSVCKGIAIGPIYQYRRVEIDISDATAENPAKEWELIVEASKKAEKRLGELYDKTLETIGSEEAEIFDMHRLMLTDDDFVEAIKAKVEDESMNAMKAVKTAGTEFAAFFAGLEDKYMQERAVDVRDVTALLLETLAGADNSAVLSVPSVIIADDLTPSETIKMDKKNILAFVTKGGSSNSHTAILARTLGIPSIVQADLNLDDFSDGTPIAVDGFDGVCYVQPDEKTLSEMAVKSEKQAEQKRRSELVRGLPSVTPSGKQLSIFANIGSNEDIASVLENDAEGIGLFRSEFLYLGRESAPTEEMQFAAYKNVAEKMQGKKVIIRTMDIGADKQVGYLDLPNEENPALGYRAIRICLDRDELFQEQLRAIWRASAFGKVSVMFPMISSVWEVRECKAALQRAFESLKAQGHNLGELEVGIMIETPASVIIRDELAKEVDFFSVGTNDLTQYTLAADRQNQKLERFADPHHPAIIEMLRLVAESAKKNGIWAGICGELAGDLSLTDSFIEMGYSELSVAPPQVLPLRCTVRESSK